MQGIRGRTILVTGAGQGIGRAVADRLVAEGANVVVNDRNMERAADVADELANTKVEDAGNAVAAPADVVDYEAVKGMVADAEEAFGPVEVLINNAGTFTMDLFLEENPSTWSELLEVNLLGQIHCARAVTERMVETETEGTIVAMSSDAGRNGATGQAVYAGTKAGVVGFTKSLARELARYGVTANVVAPGPTETEGLADVRDESDLGAAILESITENVPLGRLTSPDDVAGVIAFLASEDAAFLTGQVVSVSGGLTMND